MKCDRIRPARTVRDYFVEVGGAAGGDDVVPDVAGEAGAAGGVDFELSGLLPLVPCGAVAGFSAEVLVPDVPVPVFAALPVLAVPGTAGPVAVVLVPAPEVSDPAKPFPGVDSTLTAKMQSRIQNAATPMVMRVNKSPALAPKALWPPMPPNAPAKPPPRPRCSKTIMIKNAAVANSKNPKMNPMIDNSK